MKVKRELWKLIAGAVFALMAVVAVSCSSENEPLPEVPDEEEEIDDPLKDTERRAPLVEIALDEEQAAYVLSVNEFGSKMWDALTATPELEDKNIIFSPLSLQMMLGMLANGADGETMAQIAEALCGETVEDDCLLGINEFNRHLIAEMPKVDTNVKISLSNAVWHGAGFGLTDAFVDAVDEYYGALVDSYAVGTTEGMNTINKWIADNTFNIIPEFFTTPPASDVVLANVCAFKAKWDQKFKEEKTTDDLFWNITGESSEAKMMHQTDILRCYESDMADIVRMIYSNGGYVIDLYRPKNEEDGFAGMMSDTGRGEDVWKKVNIKMPRFGYESKINAGSALAIAGYDKIVGQRSDYSRMSAKALGLELEQKAKIEVDENGTSAAAATVSMGAGAGPDMKEYEVLDFVLDHPFAFAIREKTTGVILFMGRVCKL